MARTTLDLDPGVLEKLKRRCAVEHKSMGTVASELLAHSLSETTNERQPVGNPHPIPEHPYFMIRYSLIQV